MNTKLFLIATLTSLNLQVHAGNGLTVHEWGTFTSIQGTDGVPIAWNPLVTTDLPGFVHDLNKPTADSNRRTYASFAGKTAMLALQRMETPVLYFYSNEPQTVNVKVDFPQGIITEWYPQAAEIGSLIRSTEGGTRPKSSLSWQNVKLLDMKQEAQLKYPLEARGSHYYAARATEANPLEVTSASKTGSITEQEKFLFYRGVGSFQTPLVTKPDSAGNSVALENRGDGELRGMFILRIRNGQGTFQKSANLKPGEAQTIALAGPQYLKSVPSLQQEISAEMEKALIGEGLFQPEARSMVETWKDSWFTEEGLRVLYILPGKWTDRTLPLQVTPAPRQNVRVMVGRNEMLESAAESTLRDNIVKYSQSADNEKEQIIAATRNLKLGRFLEAATRRVLGKAPSKAMSQAGWALMDAVTRADKQKQVAVN